MFKKFTLCISVSVLLALMLFCYCMPVFYGYSDKFTVYTVSASSSGRIEGKNTADFPLFDKYGESFIKNSDEISVKEVIKRFDAKLVLTEEIAEGVSYYAYSYKIPYEKTICGRKINLHIFVGAEKTVVGTPMIFGSF